MAVTKEKESASQIANKKRKKSNCSENLEFYIKISIAHTKNKKISPSNIEI
jgi:hypothetical protein